MRALRTFLIATAVALVLVPQVAPGWIRGAAIASLISLVTGNVAVYVNPSSSGSTPCGLSGASTCQAGNDSNTCLTIAAPCKTFQNAEYIISQTLLWGFNIGSAKIYLGNGTYPETVAFSSTIGVPSKCSSASCSNVFTQLNGVEIIGNDASASSVVVSPANGTCNKGAWGMPGTVLNFLSGTYVLHGFSVNASSEATYECSVISLWSGVHVATSGVMNVGPAAGGGYIFHLGGGGVIGITTANVTIGNNVTGGFINIFNGGLWLDDQGTINFVDSGTIPTGYGHGVLVVDTSGSATLGSYDTITGGISSGPCYSISGGAMAGGNNGVMKQQIVSGCSVSQSFVYGGAFFQEYLTASGLATHFPYNQSPASAPPVVSSCGSGGALVDAPDATDTSGTIAVGSGATGCTLTFQNNQWLEFPDCMVTGGLAVTIAGSSPYTGWSVTSGSISGTKLVYHCLFHL